MSRAVAVALVGCGRVAERGYLPALARSTSLVLAAVADPARERRARLAPGVPGFDRIDELLASLDVDLVVVATPPDLHLGVASAASAAGVRSLVEKPPAADRAGAAALAALEPAPWVGFDRRFDPAVGRLRNQVIDHAKCDVAVALAIEPERWGAFGGSPGPLLDLGPHAVDLACWLTRRAPLRVRADGAQGSEAAFVVDLEEGSASVRVSHGRGWREEIRVTAGRATRRVRRGGLVDRARRAFRRGPGPLVATLGAQLEAAGRAVRGETTDPRLAPAADGVRAMAVLDAAAAAALAPGAWVEVEV